MNVSHQRSLAEAEMYAAEGIELIRRQRGVIEEMKRAGRDTSCAQRQLHRLRGAHAALEENRATLMADMAA